MKTMLPPLAWPWQFLPRSAFSVMLSVLLVERKERRHLSSLWPVSPLHLQPWRVDIVLSQVVFARSKYGIASSRMKRGGWSRWLKYQMRSE